MKMAGSLHRGPTFERLIVSVVASFFEQAMMSTTLKASRLDAEHSCALILV
jgi:hypothetical protein